MKYYFDTNVFHHLAQLRETRAFARLMRGRGGRLLISSAHLTEVLRIDDPSVRGQRVGSILSFPVEFLPFEPVRLCEELINEVTRVHPHWIIRPQPVGLLHKSKMAHQRAWQELAQRPNERSQRIDDFWAHEARWAGIHRDKQKLTKARLALEGGNIRESLPIDEAETYWRHFGMKSWTQDVFERTSLDTSKLVADRLDLTRIGQEAWVAFWMKEITAGGMPRLRAMGMVDYVQRRHALSPGNMVDTSHAANLLDSDRFVTADRTFAKVLRDLDGPLPTGSRLVDLDLRSPLAQQVFVRK